MAVILRGVGSHSATRRLESTVRVAMDTEKDQRCRDTRKLALMESARKKRSARRKLERHSSGEVNEAMVARELVSREISKLDEALRPPKQTRPYSSPGAGNPKQSMSLRQLPFKPLKKHVAWLTEAQKGGRCTATLTLTDEIESFSGYVKLDEAELGARESMLMDIRDAIRTKYPQATLSLFGSYPVGLSVFSSDIDVSVNGALGSASSGSTAVTVGQQSSSGTKRTASKLLLEPGAANKRLRFDEDGAVVQVVGPSSSLPSGLVLVVDQVADTTIKGEREESGEGEEEVVSWVVDSVSSAVAMQNVAAPTSQAGEPKLQPQSQVSSGSGVTADSRVPGVLSGSSLLTEVGQGSNRRGQQAGKKLVVDDAFDDDFSQESSSDSNSDSGIDSDSGDSGSEGVDDPGVEDEDVGEDGDGADDGSERGGTHRGTHRDVWHSEGWDDRSEECGENGSGHDEDAGNYWEERGQEGIRSEDVGTKQTGSPDQSPKPHSRKLPLDIDVPVWDGLSRSSSNAALRGGVDGVLEDAVVDELLGRAGGGAASLKAQRAAEEAERKAKLDALDKIYKAIRKMLWVRRSEFRRHARVPIINLVHKNGVECDISVDMAAQDTSQVVASLIQRCGPALFALSAFLKVFLEQLGLDAPFTGGLGSYKLYVLLARHIEDHPELVADRERPQLGPLLMGFLQHYGQKRNLNATTVVEVEGAEEVTFRGANRIDEVCAAFLKAHDVLKKLCSSRGGDCTGTAVKGKATNSAVVVPRPAPHSFLNNQLSTSYLAPLLNSAHLCVQRQKSRALCQRHPIRTDEEREAAARAVLAELHQRHGSALQRAATLEEVDATNPAFGARLRSYASAVSNAGISEQRDVNPATESRLVVEAGPVVSPMEAMEGNNIQPSTVAESSSALQLLPNQHWRTLDHGELQRLVQGRLRDQVRQVTKKVVVLESGNPSVALKPTREGMRVDGRDNGHGMSERSGAEEDAVAEDNGDGNDDDDWQHSDDSGDGGAPEDDAGLAVLSRTNAPKATVSLGKAPKLSHKLSKAIIEGNVVLPDNMVVSKVHRRQLPAHILEQLGPFSSIAAHKHYARRSVAQLLSEVDAWEKQRAQYEAALQAGNMAVFGKHHAAQQQKLLKLYRDGLLDSHKGPTPSNKVIKKRSEALREREALRQYIALRLEREESGSSNLGEGIVQQAAGRGKRGREQDTGSSSSSTTRRGKRARGAPEPEHASALASGQALTIDLTGPDGGDTSQFKPIPVPTTVSTVAAAVPTAHSQQLPGALAAAQDCGVEGVRDELGRVEVPSLTKPIFGRRPAAR